MMVARDNIQVASRLSLMVGRSPSFELAAQGRLDIAGKSV